jgi:hypothetical protein
MPTANVATAATGGFRKAPDVGGHLAVADHAF